MSDFVDDSKPSAEEVGAEGDDASFSLSNSDVTTKYQEASKIVNSTLLEIIAMCVPGAKVVEICKAGDESIVTKCQGIYQKKKDGKTIEKGIAFPVCLSVNNCVCHYSPLESDTQLALSDGDMVKIDLGCHVDGYIAVAAHTITVAADQAAPMTVSGSKADCMLAAFEGAEIAARLIRPGNTNKQVTEAMVKVAEAYGVNAIGGTLMHQMKRYVIDAQKTVALREEDGNKIGEVTFEQFEVYAVDVAMTTGPGTPREMDARTTVFKANVDKKYQLKMKGSRTLLSEVKSKFPTMPFTIRALEDERNAKLGVRECVQHELLTPYPVLYERAGDTVVHVKFTVLVLPSGPSKVTGIQLLQDDNHTYTPSEGKGLTDELKTILASEMNKKKDKKNKKKAAAAGSS